MKKVLFIGTTFYDFRDPETVSHLKEKFEGLATSIRPYILGRGKPFYKKIWDSDFYLLPNRFLYWLLVFKFGFFICLIKNIDTIVAQSPLIEGFVGALLKKFLRQDLIVEVHGDWQQGPFLSKKRRLRWLQKKFIPVLAKFSLRTADKVRAISQFTKNQALQISGPKPCFVFPTFTDIDTFLAEKDVSCENFIFKRASEKQKRSFCFSERAQKTHPPGFILFVGALERVKAVDILIKAFAKIKCDTNDTNFYANDANMRIKTFKLVLIGEGSEVLNLKSEILNLKLENRVEFKGKLSLEETKNIMKNCYCLVLPSLSEGLGRVLMEAMALGKPVIGSNVGGIPDLIKDGEDGFLFERGNSNDLAEKLKILLKDKNSAIEMGKRGREFVKENFSNQKYIENYLKMIIQ